ncbi:hypothetical protein C8J55DRAFT_523379 [Lentinula edodes]|uniref:F-box domain-containing protein n=1 Tax=Lentinula lateritia TaxID=40482 RepID=A0A9W9DGM0_9AGAR|nr:hypothetical protein C8J55DRAFT_523379 [Lentinula edodes]
MLTVGLNSCPNSQSFLIQLPPEIISQIVDYCPSSSIPALSIVCKSTQEFGVRSLYRHLSFTKASRFLKCCYALIRNNGAASSVRGLQINLVDRHILFAFFQILATVLRRLHNLQCLEVLHDGPGFQWALESCYFPHLSLLRTRLPLTQDLINFFSRHSSTISELHLDGQSSIFTLSPAPINLLNLTSFTGNPGFVRFIVQKQDKPRLSSAHMTSLNIMDLEEVEIIEAMKHLQDVAGETLRTVTIVGSGFAGPLARHASNYLTNLKVLGLMHLSFMEIELFSTEQLCEEVKLLLPNLPQLQRLIMGRMHSVSTQTQTSDYAEGHKQVVEFSSICPGLDFVCLPDDTEWNRIRIPNNGSSYFYIWFPEVSQFSVASAWQLLDILCAEGRKYPSWLSLLKLILKEAVGKWYLNEARENASNSENGPDIQESIRTAIETLLNEIDKRVEGN